MATQIQICSTWQHKYNMATQIQHGKTNANWQNKYKFAGGDFWAEKCPGEKHLKQDMF